MTDAGSGNLVVMHLNDSNADPDGENAPPELALFPWAPFEVFALSAFAISQPLYSLLGANATFFVANGVTGTSVIWFALIVLLLPGALLAGLDAVLIRFGGRHARALHAGVLGSLAALTVGVPVLRALGAVGVVYLGGLVALAVGLGTLIRVHPRLREFARWAIFAPLLFLGLFLFTGPVSNLLSGPAAAQEVPGLDGDSPSVAMVVFDQLPLTMLVDPEGGIDPEWFPGFARLAERSTWYPGATSLVPRTEVSVPSLLTGTIPRRGDLPVNSVYPTNIFSMLGDTHDVYADEYVTQLCPDSVCGSAVEAPSTLWKDTTAILVRTLLDERTADALVPRIDGRWNDFSGNVTVAGEATNREEILERRKATADDTVRFDAFIDELAGLGSSERPDLHYLHLFQPHEPLRYLPDGRVHNPGGPFRTDEDGVWPDDPAMMDQRLQEYLAQTMHADQEVSRILDRMDELGTSDSTILIVTSDHGVGLAPGTPNKHADGDSDPDELREQLRVPLFISVPGRPAGVEHMPIQLPDVLPTLLDLLGADTTAIDMDGIPAERIPDSRRPVILTQEGTVPSPEVPPAPGSATPRRIRTLMVEPGVPYRFGPASDSFGEPLPAPVDENAALHATLDADGPARWDRAASDTVPAVVNAVIEGADGSTDVLVALNGTVAGGGRTFEHDGTWHLSVLVDPQMINDGNNSVELLQVTAGGLRRIDT